MFGAFTRAISGMFYMALIDLVILGVGLSIALAGSPLGWVVFGLAIFALIIYVLSQI